MSSNNRQMRPSLGRDTLLDVSLFMLNAFEKHACDDDGNEISDDKSSKSYWLLRPLIILFLSPPSIAIKSKTTKDIPVDNAFMTCSAVF